MIYEWSEEEKTAVLGIRHLVPDNKNCRFLYPCRPVIVNAFDYGEILEKASDNLKRDGLRFFCETISSDADGQVPVPLSDQASSEIMDIINKINYVMANFENLQILCNGLVYAKPKLAEYPFVQMMDTETYLLKLMGSSALREGIIKHLNTLNRLMSNPSCELFPQLRLDLDLIEVSGGKFFQISKRKFIDCPFEAKEFGKVSLDDVLTV